MNGEKSPKSHKIDSALDKLSNLPSCVMDQILCLLPIKDAVRTSVLSSQWQFKWTTMSDLVFDHSALSRNNPVNVIDHALLLHTGTISKFELIQRDPISRKDLGRWIMHLSRRHVQDFKLILWEWEGTRYKLHSRLFSFQDLVHLNLGECHLKLPSTFGGFKKLKSLTLFCVDMTQDAFETLISSCPILERLTLLYVECFNHLNIDAPNLLKIVFIGCFDDMNLINCSKLEEVSINLSFSTADATDRIKAWDSSNLLKFFSNLSHIKWLKIEGNFLKHLATGDIPRQPLNPCTNLGYLYLEICNDDYAECSAALCLFRSSPNIQELRIDVEQSLEGEDITFWESKHANCCFNKLRTVNIYPYALNKNELELIGFILLASPVLQKMTIEATSSASENQALQFATELLRFQRASTKAEVVFKL